MLVMATLPWPSSDPVRIAQMQTGLGKRKKGEKRFIGWVLIESA
jgi:Rad3-related DNA helicase